MPLLAGKSQTNINWFGEHSRVFSNQIFLSGVSRDKYRAIFNFSLPKANTTTNECCYYDATYQLKRHKIPIYSLPITAYPVEGRSRAEGDPS